MDVLKVFAESWQLVVLVLAIIVATTATFFWQTARRDHRLDLERNERLERERNMAKLVDGRAVAVRDRHEG